MAIYLAKAFINSFLPYMLTTTEELRSFYPCI